MSSIDLPHLRSWIGNSRHDEDLIALRHARLMAATVDYPAAQQLQNGALLPHLWHWLYFLESAPTSELGNDGHPARGGFMPPVPLPNRMWAGGRVTFLAPLVIGDTIRKESRIITIDHKEGRSGDLLFVTLLHELRNSSGELLISEEQDIVYKEAARPVPGAVPPGAATPDSTPCTMQFSSSYTPSAAMLFRYSALTFNGHRIHYDADYCREVEGYHSPVIHGPLNATMLAGFAAGLSSKPLRRFSYRGVAPVLLGDRITMGGDINGSQLTVTALRGDGTPCMQATAETE